MEDLNYTLADMEPQETGTIQEVAGENTSVIQRLLELGFVPGARVRCLGIGMGGSPVRVELDGKSAYALRRTEATCIQLT
jgi:ferrous iron transport protein A